MWADLHAVRASLVEVLDGMSQAELVRVFLFPWGEEGTACDWLSLYLAHDRERAEGIPIRWLIQWGCLPFSYVEEVDAPLNLRCGGSKSLTCSQFCAILNVD